MKWKTMIRRVQGKTLELLLLIGVLAIAGIITIYRVFPADTIGYFADVTTPLIIVVAVLLLISGARHKKKKGK